VKLRTALTVAGSDSGGGAGIQADLKTFSALGVYGLSAITSVTAQNTRAVTRIFHLPADMVGAQIAAVFDDLPVHAVKTGMLGSGENVEAVAKELKHYKAKNIVVDPVMVAKSGAALLEPDAEELMVKRIVPLATVLTPNRFEAERITGRSITDEDGAIEAGRTLHRLGAAFVVVKGGHFSGELATDYLVGPDTEERISSPRVDTKNTHGTGCTFSSAIAAYLALGVNVLEAVRRAKVFVYRAIYHGLELGGGHGPANQLVEIIQSRETLAALGNVLQAVRLLEADRHVSQLIPEVQSNLAMVPLGAIHPEEAIGIQGRIARMGDVVRVQGQIVPGGSGHVARTAFEASRHDPTIRAAMNVRYGPDVLKACERLGFVIGTFSRSEEAASLKEREGRTVSWGTRLAIQRIGRVPDIIYDRGEVGKEPMARVFGKNAVGVAKKVLRLARELSRQQ
jgi:hydroxymethylpyrimidine kinase/phosphomethylpyrimidine kinase